MTTTRYYHGGQKGLKAGDFIQPPNETNVRHTLFEYGTGAAGVARRDRVYATPDHHCAVMYAALHPSGGAVYEVEPVGTLEPDPDCTEPGLSWACDRARIVMARGLSARTRQAVLRAVL